MLILFVSVQTVRISFGQAMMSGRHEANDNDFVLPEQVYEEPTVSWAMDGVQRYIANADNRSADEVEWADAALAALTAQHLSAGTATEVYIYTTDIAADEGAKTVLSSEGYEDSVAGDS